MAALQGKTILVTGGAQGIGEASAKALAAAGATVVVGDVDSALAEASARAYGGLGLPLDVTSRESFVAFLDKAEAECGRIHGLVNNAGIMVIGRHLETPLDKQLLQLQVNLAGVIQGCHEVAPRMVSAGGGQIVNIASLAGVIATPGSAVYSATKAGVLAFTDALDAELAASGVRVAAVLPAFTSTGLIDGTTAPKAAPPITPEQVAEAVVSLMIRHRPRRVVPRVQAPSVLQWQMLPTPAKRWLSHKLGIDTMFTDFDHTGRAGYDERVERVERSSS